MHPFTITLTLLLISVQISAQQIGHTTITFSDPARNYRQITTEVYYPATVAGDDTPLAEGVYPIITFGHGFVMTWSAYQNYWQSLVPEGYILAFPTTESSFIPNHEDFGKDLKFIITAIQNNGVSTIIPATGIAATSAIMGHSMGGGSAFLAAEYNTTITTMVSFAAANTNPSSIDASTHVSVPTLLFSGVNDCVTPPAEHQDIMYDSAAAAYKTQVNIIGGGHCFFANDNFNCSFGESVCSPDPTITREEQHDITNVFLQPWLAYYLKDECQAAQQFQDSLLTSARINYRQSLPIGCTTGTSDIRDIHDQVSTYPNPCSSFITVETPHDRIRSVMLYNTTMQSAREFLFSDTDGLERIDLSSLPNGLYFICINNGSYQRLLKGDFEE